MAEPGLIAAYLTELRYSTSKLADIDDVVAEAEDHLLASVEPLLLAGGHGWTRTRRRWPASALRLSSHACSSKKQNEEEPCPPLSPDEPAWPP